LHKNFKKIASSVDLNGVEFISVSEATNFPFYGVQFHPEKNAFD
jgi:gamma-glutamyl hydrolase